MEKLNKLNFIKNYLCNKNSIFSKFLSDETIYKQNTNYGHRYRIEISFMIPTIFSSLCTHDFGTDHAFHSGHCLFIQICINIPVSDVLRFRRMKYFVDAMQHSMRWIWLEIIKLNKLLIHFGAQALRKCDLFCTPLLAKQHD